MSDTSLTVANVRAFLPQHDIPDEQGALIVRLVRGWLLDALGSPELPDQLGEVLWGDALELAALVADNPTYYSQRYTGSVGRMWGQKDQREVILDRVRTRVRLTALAPQGSYPDPIPWGPW